MDLIRPMAFTRCMAVPQKTVWRDVSVPPVWNRHRPDAAEYDTLIVVQREWSGWRTGMVPLGNLKEIRWFQPTGAPRPLIHAYVSCTDIHSGDLQHDCELTSAPHRLLVCVLKSHTAPSVFNELARRASRSGDPDPAREM